MRNNKLFQIVFLASVVLSLPLLAAGLAWRYENTMLTGLTFYGGAAITALWTLSRSHWSLSRFTADRLIRDVSIGITPGTRTFLFFVYILFLVVVSPNPYWIGFAVANMLAIALSLALSYEMAKLITGNRDVNRLAVLFALNKFLRELKAGLDAFSYIPDARETKNAVIALRIAAGKDILAESGTDNLDNELTRLSTSHLREIAALVDKARDLLTRIDIQFQY